MKRPNRPTGWMPSRFPERPLDHFTSLKMKFAAVILCAVGTTVLVFYSGVRLGVWPSVSGIVAAAISLLFVRVIASGLTSPLREMAAAAEAMARGDYSRRVSDTSRDELGALGRAFNAMASELGETDRVRRDLIANVSHELRTPITALQAVLENLVDGVEPADPETLRTMLAQVERLGRLVKQLLDLSRLESGAAVLDRQDFEIEPLLEGAVREARLNAPADVAIRVDVEPHHLAADGDPERIHQVVANLLENALRHSPPGGTVELRARVVRGTVTVEVDDQGPGILDSEVDRIFERFYRADSARAAHDGGAGLGLAIAQWIVGLHGGAIRPERREPHGCRMVFSLPATTSAPAVPVPASGGVR
ncbi:MAG: HAMP domain-containing protein [Acidimicrobiia bacterium]|nr:HAMP domain-containing protein [Acidimicrobiia bacterium]